MSSPEAAAAFGPASCGRFDQDAVAALAVKTVLSVPEAKANESLGRLLHFILTPEPVVEALAVLFLPAGVSIAEIDAEALLEIAVAGKIVYAHIRWLDDLADSDGPLDPPRAVHQLSGILSREALKRLAVGIRGSAEDVGGFFSSLADLNARYAASLALDAASSRGIPLIGLSLEDYIEHAKSRAAPLRAPVDALHALVRVGEEVKRRGRLCFELTAAAMQLYDDTLDVEEDYKDRRLSWIVAETLLHLGDPDERPEADEFFETALLAGVIERNLVAAEELYMAALSVAEEALPGCVEFLQNEAQQTRALKGDMARIVSSARGTEGRPGPGTKSPNNGEDRDDEPAP